ncbi:MAG: hypothetical protein RR863_01855 [Erysipelotrichaceae bacterium]
MKNLSHKQIILILLLVITAVVCAYALYTVNLYLSVPTCIIVIILAICLSESLKQAAEK